MRLSEDEILNQLVHEDLSARRLALSYLSGTFSKRPEILSKLREAWETFGKKEAFGHLPNLSWLHPTEDILPWLVEEIEAQPAPKERFDDEDNEAQDEDDEDIDAQLEEDEQTAYADGLQQMIFWLSPTALRPYAERLSAASCVDENFRERLQWNLEREHATATDAWDALLEWQAGVAAEYTTWDGDEDEEFDIPDGPSADAWSDVLLRNIHSAPRKAIVHHLSEIYEESREFPDDLLTNTCLQAISAAQDWNEALPLIMDHAVNSDAEMSAEVEDAIAQFPAAKVLPYVQKIVADAGHATADMALMLVHFRSPEVLATAAAMLPIADSKLTAGILCEALCLQYDSEGLELAAVTSRELGIVCMTNVQLIATATALNIEHPDLPEWQRLFQDADARSVEMTQLMIEAMQCGPDCGHDHHHHGELDDEFGDELDDEDLDDEDDEPVSGLGNELLLGGHGHTCAPDCGHDHDNGGVYTPPSSPDTFKHDTIAVGRNEPCPCGSGKKFKKCCMRG
jgi:hypothetical protein